MKTLNSIFAAGLILVALSFLAGCKKNETASASTSATPYPLEVCIVSGEKLGSMGDPVVQVQDGQEVKFCCKDCIKEFEDAPAKFMAKLKPGGPESNTQTQDPNTQ